MVSYASLDKDGNLLTGENFTKDPHKKQDPASITKLVALDTMMEVLGDKWPKFARDNQHALVKMMSNSHNGFTNQLACKAMNPNIGDVSNLDVGMGENYPTPAQKKEIQKFVARMNENAAKVLGFKEGDTPSTHFETVEGMPRQGHYTTAYDMARLMRHFQERPKSQTDLADIEGGSGYAVITHDGVKGFKTGTASGYHGDSGKSSGLGATDNGGAFCVLGVSGIPIIRNSSRVRDNLCNKLADQLNTGITAEQQGEIMFSHGDGAKGSDPHDIESVKEIQQALKMPEKYQTGFYGDKTTAAVLKFQKDYNNDKKGDEKLPETGMLDERSYRTLVVGAVAEVQKKPPIEAPASSAEALGLNKKKTESAVSSAPATQSAPATNSPSATTALTPATAPATNTSAVTSKTASVTAATPSAPAAANSVTTTPATASAPAPSKPITTAPVTTPASEPPVKSAAPAANTVSTAAATVTTPVKSTPEVAPASAPVSTANVTAAAPAAPSAPVPASVPAASIPAPAVKPNADIADTRSKDASVIDPEKCKKALKLLDLAYLSTGQSAKADAGADNFKVYAMQTALNVIGYSDVKPSMSGNVDEVTKGALADFNQRSGGDAGQDSVALDSRLAQKVKSQLREEIKTSAGAQEKEVPSKEKAPGNQAKYETVKAVEDVIRSGTKLADSSHTSSDVNFKKSNIPVVSSTEKSIA